MDNAENKLAKMEAKHGPADADEVEHYESCECCGNFHRMEQAHDRVQKVGIRLVGEKAALRIDLRATIRSLKGLVDNINEFGHVTDGEILEQAIVLLGKMDGWDTPNAVKEQG